MTRTTVTVESARAMFLLFIFPLLGVLPARAFLPISPLTDCPKIPAQNDIKLDQVAGSWRLAYLFIDDNDELEEDNTCAVAEIMQVNQTQMELLLYVDGRKDESTIDRYTKEFDLTVLSPGEWLLHTSFMHLEFIHVTVIGASANHLVLTFCINLVDLEDTPNTEAVNDYDTFLHTVDRDSMDDIFQAQKYSKLFKDLDDLNAKMDRHRRIRGPSRLLRGKRRARNSEEFPGEEDSRYDKMMKYLKANKVEEKPKKHLWTAILVKNNNVSALKFVENASLLMKLGYKVTKGQLISFGRCSLAKK